MGGGGVAFAGGEGGECAVQVLHVGEVAADADYGGGVEGAEAFDVGEAGEGTVGSWVGVSVWGGRWEVYGVERDEPRLSAAITTPFWNLTAMTEVPVTVGDWVCCLGPVEWRYEAS